MSLFSQEAKVKTVEGEGTPKKPPLEIMLDWKLNSTKSKINSSQLNSFVSRSPIPSLSGRGGCCRDVAVQRRGDAEIVKLLCAV